MRAKGLRGSQVVMLGEGIEGRAVTRGVLEPWTAVWILESGGGRWRMRRGIPGDEGQTSRYSGHRRYKMERVDVCYCVYCVDCTPPVWMDGDCAGDTLAMIHSQAGM